MSGSRIYIGHLSSRAGKRDVEKYFKHYGEIRDINLKNGFGFVEFKDYRDAEDAVKDCNGRDFFDHRIIVEIARGEKRERRNYDRRDYDRRSNNAPQRTDNRVFVENIASDVSWQDLKDFFRRAGRVTFADAHKRKEGEGIVEFQSYDDVKEALRSLDGVELKGQKIYLRDGSRRYSSSRRYSRSRSRNRSRSRKRSYSRDRRYSPRRSRSRSRSRSGSASRTRSRSRSNSRFRDQSRSRSPSQDYNDKDNNTNDNKNENKNENNDNRSRSRSHSRSQSRSRSHSRSQSRSPRSNSRSRSRTPSKSPERKSPREESHSVERQPSRSPEKAD